MKAKLIVEGREFPIEINDPELQKLLKPLKKTGYERVERGKTYYNVSCDDVIDNNEEAESLIDVDLYGIANYYSDLTVAENNARADKLMRQLRRFAVEHRETDLNWYCTEGNIFKYYIYYDYSGDALRVEGKYWTRHLFGIYFNSKSNADLAIETFHDELIWYFTEYKDSL